MFVFIIFILLISILFGKGISKSIFHPIRVYSLIWTSFIVIPVLLYNDEYKWKYLGLLWISFTVIFLEVGAFICKKRFLSEKLSTKILIKKCENKLFNYDAVIAFKALTVILALGLLNVFFYMSSKHIGISSFLSLNNLLNINAEAAYERYYEEATLPMLVRVFNIFLYAGAICGGYAYNYAKKKLIKMECFLVLIPTIMISLLSNAKAGLIATIMLWFSGWIVSYLKINGYLPTINISKIIMVLLIAALVIGLLYVIMLLRIGDFSEAGRRVVTKKIIDYAFGQMIQFDGWFYGESSVIPQGFGVNTYLWLPNLMGIVQRSQGVYEPYVREYSNNVFTAFRGVISDFGIIGGLVFYFLRGYITEYIFIKISISESSNVISMVLLVACQFYILYGFIISPWIYSSYFFMLILFGIFIILFHRIRDIKLWIS